MTLEEFEAIASALREYREDIRKEHANTMLARHKLDTVDDVVEVLSDLFEARYRRFQGGRFRMAAR